MTPKNNLARRRDDLDLVDLSPEKATFLDAVQRGLSKPDKTLPTQYLYDARGSALFDQICELPEYYPTRTEIAIMDEYRHEMADRIGERAMVIEFGSGSGLKTRFLLQALHHPSAYVPVEISRDHLLSSSARLDREFPELEVLPVCADFTAPFELPTPARPVDRRVVYFPGSTIGNFEPEQARRLLATMVRLAGPDGGVLIGVDLRKDKAVLERAYNDAAGVTAAFNLNLLHRINRELDGDFDVDAFRHRAIYDEEAGRIVMYLDALRTQKVRIGGRTFQFDAGESICTEYSHKYTLDGFAALAGTTGLRLDHVWTDRADLFSVQFLTVRPAPRRA